MILRASLAGLLAFAIALMTAPAQADLLDKQPLYIQIASTCGEDPSKPKIPDHVYVLALAEAATAMKAARKDGNRVQQNAITHWVEKVKECREQDAVKFHIPPITSCADFVMFDKSMSAWTATMLKEGRITEEYRDRLRGLLYKPALECVTRLMSSCIDPTKTSKVLAAVEAIDAAASYGFVYTYSKMTGMTLIANKYLRGNLRLRFCTDTDFACKGDPDICLYRVQRIKAVLDAYIEG
jgi:hypothetical protein